MYCTECKIAFSWNTGKIDNGPVHNPHFYQLMAQQNNGHTPRNPHDVLCGGLINYYQVAHITRTIISISYNSYTKQQRSQLSTLDTYVLNLHRLASHITNYELPRLRTRITTLTNNIELRVKYLNNKISKEELSNQAYRNDTLRKKTIEIIQIYELLSVYSIENFANIANNIPHTTTAPEEKKNNIEYIENIVKFIDEFKQLIKYTNREMKFISITYNHIVMIITDNFEWTHSKFTKSQLTDIMSQEISIITHHQYKNSCSGAGSSTDPL